MRFVGGAVVGSFADVPVEVYEGLGDEDAETLDFYKGRQSRREGVVLSWICVFSFRE